MIVDCAHYRDGERQHEGPLDIEQAAEAAKGDGDFVWLGLHEPDDDELDHIAGAFGLHELAVEDAEDAHQRPKLEDYDDSFFIVLRTARYDDEREEVRVRRDPRLRRPRLRDRGPPWRRRASCARPGASLEEHADLLQRRPGGGRLGDPRQGRRRLRAGRRRDRGRHRGGRGARSSRSSKDSTQRIYFLKREVIEFHRAVSPLLVPLEALERGAYVDVDEQLRRYFRDVADHARRVDEQVTGPARAADLDPRGEPGAARRASRTRWSGRSRRRPRSSPCRPSWRASGG